MFRFRVLYGSLCFFIAENFFRMLSEVLCLSVRMFSERGRPAHVSKIAYPWCNLVFFAKRSRFALDFFGNKIGEICLRIRK